MAGRELSKGEISELWEAWTLSDVAQRLSGVAPRGTSPPVGRWSCSPATPPENTTISKSPYRKHDSTKSWLHFPALTGMSLETVGSGPTPTSRANHHQTWLREPATGRYHIDVFREPHIDGLWVCRRNASITLPYGELILRTSEGIPYATPEVALLFKAKQVDARRTRLISNVCCP